MVSVTISKNNDDDTSVLFGRYSADAEIKGVSGCKGINMNVSLGSETLPMQWYTGTPLFIESTCRDALSKYPPLTNVNHHSEVVYRRCHTHCWESLQTSDLWKKTINAASRGGMW